MKIITTKPTRPPRIIIYGDHKVGKSSFAASCPAPIFIDSEGGLESLSVNSFEQAKTYDDIIKALEFLVKEDHQYKTLVLDSLDWTEKLIFEKVCKENNWQQIGDGAYGAGYKLAMNLWRRLIRGFEILNSQKKMLIVLIAHAKVSKFEDPERENYDRWTLDLNDKSGKMICEYVDIIGFANYKVAAVTKKEGFGGEVTKIKSTGQRVLNLNNKASFEAGNRYALPDQLPLAWDSLSTEIQKYFSKQQTVKAEPVKDFKDLPRNEQEKIVVKDMTTGPLPILLND